MLKGSRPKTKRQLPRGIALVATAVFKPATEIVKSTAIFCMSENIYIFAGVTGFERKYAEPRIAPEYSKVGEQISLYNVPYIDIEDISAE